MKKIMSRQEILAKRREKLNAELAKIACPGRISKIGAYQKGEHELLKIAAVYRHSRPFYWIVTFLCRKPFTGEIVNYTIKFSTGMVIVPIINGSLLLKKEFRVPVGKWLYEFPRAFINLLAKPEEVEKNSCGILKQILKNEVDSVLNGNPEIEVKLLSESWEDSSISNVCNSFFVVRIRNCKLKEEISRKKTISWKLFTLAEARQAVKDDHSKSALLGLMNEIDFNGFCLDD